MIFFVWITQNLLPKIMFLIAVVKMTRTYMMKIVKRIIKRDISGLHCAKISFSREALVKKFQDNVYGLARIEWGEYVRNRSTEFRMLEKTIVFKQWLLNYFLHAWKHIYQDVNDFYNKYCALNSNRIKLFSKELEYFHHTPMMYSHWTTISKEFTQMTLVYQDIPSFFEEWFFACSL